MIELNSLFVVLMIEGLLSLIVLVLGYIFFIRRKSSKGQQAATELIDKLEDTAYLKVNNIDDLMSKHCSLNPQLQNEILTEMNCNERALYKQIIQMVLNRDVESLKQVDQYIDNLTEPYCKAIKYSDAHVSDNKDDTELLQTEDLEIEKLKQESIQLEEQLTVAMTTMDEISNEYTRVFSGTQTEMMLENSSKKMFDIFQKAEQKIKDSFNLE